MYIWGNYWWMRISYNHFIFCFLAPLCLQWFFSFVFPLFLFCCIPFLFSSVSSFFFFKLCVSVLDILCVVTIRLMKKKVSSKQQSFFFWKSVISILLWKFSPFSPSPFMFVLSQIILVYSTSLLMVLLVVCDLLFISFGITSLIISCNRGLLVINSLRFCMSGKVFIASSYLKGNFAEYIILGW